jgi:3-hydroxyisobutyrate dehydrogenase-like beta-hydroxyacid dehydrogenase
MTDVSFLGLGQMGSPMARRLLEAGHHLTVWNRTAERADPLREAGASVATSPADAAAESDVVITMLTDEGALEQVVGGEEGVARGIRDGSVLVDMSTVGPEAVRRLRSSVPEGVAVLDAPVLGSTPQAEAGQLSVFVGGPREAYERVEEVLGVLGSPRHVGGLGSGAALKLVLNSTLGAVLVGVGEALALADALGLDPAVTLDALEGAPVGATVKRKRQMIESGSYPSQFRLSLASKDLRLVTEAAERAGLSLELAALARRSFEEAERRGRGDEDYSALIAVLRGR